MIDYQCPGCGKKVSVSDDRAGMIAKCGKCGEKGRVPDVPGWMDVDDPPQSLADIVKPPRPTPAYIPEPLPHSVPSTFGITMLLCLILAVSIAGLALQYAIGETNKAWEYMIASFNDVEFESKMDTAGLLGWELVSARRAVDKHESAKYEMIFKRRKR